MKTDNLAKNLASTDQLMERFWDMWLVGLGSFSWTQEQFESMVGQYLQQRKTAREESSKVIEELTRQVKNNQMQMQKMMREAVTAAFENVEIPAYNLFDQMNKKIEELSRKVENL